MMSIRLPLWLRVVSLIGVVIVVTGAGLLYTGTIPVP